jgi:hypothetical protein
MTLLLAPISSVTAEAMSLLQHSVRNDRTRSDSNRVPLPSDSTTPCVLRSVGGVSYVSMVLSQAHDSSPFWKDRVADARLPRQVVVTLNKSRVGIVLHETE